MTVETDEIVWPGGMPVPPKGKPEKRSFRVVTKMEEPYIIYLPPDKQTGKCGHHEVPCMVNGDNLSGWVCTLLCSCFLCICFNVPDVIPFWYTKGQRGSPLCIP